jgi:hemoglobin
MNVNASRAALVALLLSHGAASSGCATAPAPQAPPSKPEASGPTLYERVGGLTAISVLIDDVIERSYVDPVFHANPRVAEAHRRYPKPAYKYHATALACMVMGGPCKYTGRSLQDAHRSLQLSEPEWRELIQVFRDSMNGFKVPAREQGEVLAILEGAKGDVVPAKAASR